MSRSKASRGGDRWLEMVLVKGGVFRSCTLVFLSSETALEEPFTAGEGICIGLDSETRDGRRRGSEAAIMYTRIFVHRRRSWRSRRMSEGKVMV